MGQCGYESLEMKCFARTQHKHQAAASSGNGGCLLGSISAVQEELLTD